MTAAANPVEQVGGLSSGADATDVSKPDFIAWALARVRQRIADATELAATDLTGQLANIYLASMKAEYYLDASDGTTADDGYNCIRDGASNAFKPVIAPLAAAAAAGLQINGAMSISQQNGATQITLAASTLKYVVDNFFGWYGNASAVIKGQQVTPPGTPSFKTQFGSCLQLTATTALSVLGSSDFGLIGTRIEGHRIRKLGFGSSVASFVTVGFWVYATIAGAMTVALRNAANNRAYLKNVTINNPTTWEYKTVVIPGDTTGTWAVDNTTGFELIFSFAAGSSLRGTDSAWNASAALGTSSTTNFFASTNNTVCLTGVTVLPGSVALTAQNSNLFARPFDEELARCKRYWNKSYDYGTAVAAAATINGSGCGIAYATSALAANITYEVEMRAVPTVTLYSYNGTSGVWTAGGNVDTAACASPYGGSKRNPFITSSGLTAGAVYYGHWTADARL